MAVFAADDGSPAANAQVTLTVTQFRSLDAPGESRYVDALTSLAPHPAVNLVDRAGMPTFVVKRAVNLEITIASADATESYRPLAVVFQQHIDAGTTTLDPEGAINFGQWTSERGTLVIDDKLAVRGHDSRYEFFVIVQRVSDGVIGIIDPEIEAEIQP